eukprot:4318321-Pyramimonas_sp.AAC.1
MHHDSRWQPRHAQGMWRRVGPETHYLLRARCLSKWQCVCLVCDTRARDELIEAFDLLRLIQVITPPAGSGWRDWGGGEEALGRWRAWTGEGDGCDMIAR